MHFKYMKFTSAVIVCQGAEDIPMCRKGGSGCFGTGPTHREPSWWPWPRQAAPLWACPPFPRALLWNLASRPRPLSKLCYHPATFMPGPGQAPPWPRAWGGDLRLITHYRVDTRLDLGWWLCPGRPTRSCWAALSFWLIHCPGCSLAWSLKPIIHL